MDEEDHYTPRSGRAKKKSALSKLAARKRGGLSDDDVLSGSQGSLSDKRRPSSRNSHQPMGRQYHQAITSDDESDEGISEMRHDVRYPGNASRSSDRFRKPQIQEESESDEDSIETGGYSNHRQRSYGSDSEEERRNYRKQSSKTSSGSNPQIRVNGAESPELSGHYGVMVSDRKRPSTTSLGFDPHTGLSHSDYQETYIDGETGQQRSNKRGLSKVKSDSLEDIHQQYKEMLSSNISRSDVDLRNHETLTPSSYSSNKKTTSLSQSDVHRSLEDPRDSLGELRGYGKPRPSTLSPTHGHRPQVGTATGSMQSRNYERPWSSGMGKQVRTNDMLSERSFVSTSAMPQISTTEAKSRSFLVGSANSFGSLLGAEELERLFPDRQMRVFIGSWNMCEMKKIPKSLDHFIHPDSVGDICDMYVIGTQESCGNRREWEIRLQESLGPHHVLFHSYTFGILYLNVFLRKDLVWYCSVSEEDSCSTRPVATSVKTKGAQAVSFNLFGTSFLFINCHFTPHDGKIKERIEDYKKICRSLDLPRVMKTAQTGYTNPADVTTRFDSVFWFGDMNWRIMKERDRIHSKMKGIESQIIPQYEDLLEHDELTQARTQEQVFQDFHEGRIKFKPTYKYDIGTDNYDTSPKLRIPSYTDRILFRTKRKGAVTCLHYNTPEQVKESDHRPVYGVYEVNLRPGRDNIPLSAGQFNREVWIEAIKRRALCLDVMQKIKKDKQSSVCSVQ